MSDATTIDASGFLPPEPSERRSYLLVREGERNEVIDLHSGDQVILGRAAEATVRLDDPKASREHARVTRAGDEVTVADLDSRNGTIVNTEALRGGQRRLISGDVIRIGEAEIVFAETLAPTHPEEPPSTEPHALAPPGIVIADPAMVRVFEMVRKVAPAPTTVLILGETGTGKEVVAEQLHALSPRAKRPFVRLNCGSLPETLLESELFGHEKGSFTGADQRKIGLVETADGGTLFLDEVGELAVTLQAKLLRVIENRRFMRVGGRQEITVDVRIVSATNRDLEIEAKTGRFREDLYFRLSAFVLRIPPLRERPAEVALLAELFARQFSARLGAPPPVITPDALDVLCHHSWPGNVRELRNALEHALVLVDGGQLTADHLPENVRRGEGVIAGQGGPMREQLATLEQHAIEEALAAENGNQTRAARRLGISRRALIYKLEKYGLKR